VAPGVLGEKDDTTRSMAEAADVVEKEALQLEWSIALSDIGRPPRRLLHWSDNRRASRIVRGLRRVLRERLGLLFQRAPIEAGALFRPFDGLLIKAPHEDRAHPVLHTRSLWSTERRLPFGCHFGAHLQRTSGLTETQNASECLRMHPNGPVTLQSGP